ncbi:MAG: T9SS type A sorting domain-containing protein [Bacteroidetes bacterium]|nr:T9SS type A sorting domain-containing protein [Bacteroidota bacterium]
MKKKIKFFLLISSIILIHELQNCFSQSISIASGGKHALFLCNNSTIMSCGKNSNGQLGNGTVSINPNSTPVLVNSLNSINSIVGGEGHSLFLKNDGTVWACGDNYYGRLGDGTNVDKPTPIQVNSLSGIIAISAGYEHSLFLKNDGSVWACGFNDFLQLGDGTTSNRYIPVQVSSLSGIIAISAGYQHSLFLKNDGTVWACGANQSGELGDGTTIARSIPVQVSSLIGITAISAGGYFSLFLKNDGTVWACGTDGYGQLGTGSSGNTSSPVQVTSLSGITAIAGNDNHSMFLKNDGSVWACGRNHYGELGDGSTVDKSIPVQVNSLSGITAIAAGGLSSLFLKNDGSVWACGYNGYGQLGDGTNVDKSIPVQVIGLCMACASPPAPTAANATLCANTTASLSATGTGTLGWYNQAVGGTYLGGGANYTTAILTTNTTYYVQDSTCAASTTRKAVIVTVNPLPVVTASASTATVCAGSSVTLTGGGASSYIWSGGINDGQGFIPTTTATYTVTGTDGNNCSNTTTKTITVNSLPIVTANASATNVCEGTSVILTGGGASSYIWTGGVNDGQGFVPTTTTTYTVTGTDGNNCSNTATKTITVNSFPDITTNLNGLTISANQVGALYEWLDCNNGSSTIIGANNQNYTAAASGNYAVIVKMNNCSDTSTCVNIITTGIEKIIKDKVQLTVFPNPGNGILTIKSASEGIYSIQSESGQMIQTFNLNTSNNYTINIENLSSGIYFIVGLNDNQMINQKVVIAR